MRIPGMASAGAARLVVPGLPALEVLCLRLAPDALQDPLDRLVLPREVGLSPVGPGLQTRLWILG